MTIKIGRISVADDFSVNPGARYREDGENSGEEFYEDILLPKLKVLWNNSNEKILIDFDGVSGYASSFISEVFTRLVKDFKDKEKIQDKIIIKTEDTPWLKDSILQIINETC
jgi:hypothetical protein